MTAINIYNSGAILTLKYIKNPFLSICFPSVVLQYRVAEGGVEIPPYSRRTPKRKERLAVCAIKHTTIIRLQVTGHKQHVTSFMLHVFETCNAQRTPRTAQRVLPAHFMPCNYDNPSTSPRTRFDSCIIRVYTIIKPGFCTSL